MELLSLFLIQKKNANCDRFVVISVGFSPKISILHKLACLFRSLLRKNLVSHFFVHTFMFMLGYYIEFRAVKRQILGQFSLKDN